MSGARNSLVTDSSPAASPSSWPAPLGVTVCAVTASDPLGRSTEQLPDVPAVDSRKYGARFDTRIFTLAAPATPRISPKHSRSTSACTETCAAVASALRQGVGRRGTRTP